MRHFERPLLRSLIPLEVILFGRTAMCKGGKSKPIKSKLASLLWELAGFYVGGPALYGICHDSADIGISWGKGRIGL